MTNAYAGYGTLLKKGDDTINNGPTYTTIAEVKDISGPEFQTDFEEVTHHNSPGAYKERIPTLNDVGTITFTVNFDPADSTHDASQGLLNDLRNQTLLGYRIVLPDSNSTTHEFNAYVSNLPFETPVDGAFESEIELQGTGQPNFDV